jgi:xylulokinase
MLADYSTSYAPDLGRPSFAEIDPERFWNAVCLACRSAAHDVEDPVRAIALSSHGETFVALDSCGQPLTRAILNQDIRAIAESAACEETIGRERLFQITGLVAHPMYPIPKILWLRQHQPDLFRRTKSFVTLIGYLLGRMGLPAYVDYSLASRFLAFDIRKRAWSDEILSATELDKAKLPMAVPAGTIAGQLNPDLSAELGVPSGTPVILGGHDQPCGALGAGVIGDGRVCASIGTYECLLAASDSPSLNDKALEASLNSYCHVLPDKFVTLAYFPSGIMVKWFHDLLYSNRPGEIYPHAVAEEFEASHYGFLEAHAPNGPTGLCITPHLIGTCNPEFNPRVRGMIAGLGPGTDRSHLYKGILEGLACELAILTEVLREAVGQFEDIYVTGGGTRSALGLELRAALTACRLHIIDRQEAVCLGTAMLAGLAVGEYTDVSQAIAALVRESAVLVPDERVATSYQDQLARYKQLRRTAVEQA